MGTLGQPVAGLGFGQARLDRALGSLSFSPRRLSGRSSPLPNVFPWDGRGKRTPLPYRSCPCEELGAVGCARLLPPSCLLCACDPFVWKIWLRPSSGSSVADHHARRPSPI